ncbi:MAG: FAD-dependent oxidoreductase [Clostridia bacterium]|nr:FAD-dependent oxidoreductase [Clostridia bacterium]
MYDAIIIGAGPAGLTSAIYLLRANKKVLVLDAKGYGGQITDAHKVENYPAIQSISGLDFAINLYNQAKNLGAEIKFEEVREIKNDKTVVTNGGEYSSKTVIIATGAAKRKLNIDKEEKLTGKGVSYCATCDGNFYKDKTVAVVGGGNTALEDAVYLSDLASKVYLIHRSYEFEGEEKYADELKTKTNVEFVLNSNVIKLNGEDKLKSVTVENGSGNKREINTEGLFIAIGHEPKNEIFSNVVDLSPTGYIKCINSVYTKSEGIYAAGDTRVKDLRQLTTAVSDGSLAATAAIKEIKGIN